MENPQAKFQYSQNILRFQPNEVQSVNHADRQFKLPYAIVEHIKKQSKSQIPRLQQKIQKPNKIKHSFLGNAISNWNQKKNKIIAMQNCPICEMQSPSKQMYSVGKDCDHKFCFSCLASYSAYKINIFELVECPQEKCRATLEKKTRVYQFLDERMKKKYQQIRNYQVVKKDKSLHLCPNQDCNGVINLFSASDRIICPACTDQFCKNCLLKFHTGNCEAHQIQFFEAGLKFRQCKSCKRVVQKISGCDHITCKCGYEFCYQCGEKWAKNHTCFNLPECFVDKPKLRLFCKTLYVVFFILILYPLILLKIFSIVVSMLLISLIIGICVQPFVIFAQLLQLGLQYLLLGLLFFPFVLVFAIIRAIKQLFDQSCGVLITTEEMISPCILTKSLLHQYCRHTPNQSIV